MNLQISDHCAVFCSFTGDFQFERNYTIKFRDNSENNINRFEAELRERLRNFHVFNDFSLNDQFEILHKILLDTYDKCCPVRSKVVSTKSFKVPWMNNYVLSCVDEKHRLYRELKSNIISRLDYKNYCSFLSKTIFQA